MRDKRERERGRERERERERETGVVGLKNISKRDLVALIASLLVG